MSSTANSLLAAVVPNKTYTLEITYTVPNADLRSISGRGSRQFIGYRKLPSLRTCLFYDMEMALVPVLDDVSWLASFGSADMSQVPPPLSAVLAHVCQH